MKESLILLHKEGRVVRLEIRFRFDKSSTNFSICRYELSSHPIFNPIDAAVSIIHRANLLRIPEEEPICAYTVTGKTIRFLKDTDVMKMREAMVGAYLNPNHYMRQNTSRIVPHSNRVTAAVALKQGNCTNDEIVYRLRWDVVTSVPTYLRECWQGIGDIL